MPQIAFDEIPYDWVEPGIYLEVKPNYRTLGILPMPVKNLIIGQKLGSGTLAPLTLVEITRPEQAIALFGLGSQGAEAVAAFRAANKTQPLFVMALADAGGAVAATGGFTFTGAVAAATVLRFKVAGRQIRFTAAAGATLAQLATALAAAINADPTLVVTAASAAGVVTVTSRHGGEIGNEIDLRVDTKAQALPSGLNVAVAPMSGGAGNPVLQTALDGIANDWVTAVQHPWIDSTNLTAFAAWLTGRFTAMTKRDALGYVAKRGIYSALITYGGLTNCPFLNAGGLRNSPTSSWNVSAAMMGVASFQLANDPARQLRSLVLPGVEAPDTPDLFIETEQDLLLRAGVSTLDALADGSVVISRAISTYKQSNLGVADRAWMDITVAATTSRIRYDWASYVSLLYPRAKLIDDDSSAAYVSRLNDDDAAGNSVVTPARMKASWAGRCRLYADRVWIEDVDRTIKESIFQRSDTDRNRLESRQQLRVVGNLMVLAGSLEFQV